VPEPLPPYAWPIKPFNRQHPVRGYLNDPRIGGGGGTAFHFGIDVSCPDGTAVYAVEGGTVHLEGGRAVGVVSSGGRRSFGYWHIVPTVIHLQQVRPRQLLGHVDDGWGHVHFAERQGRRYVNPLRARALAPFVDASSPRVERLWFERNGATIDADRVTGVVDLVAEAWDRPALPPPPPWHEVLVAPALIRWRMAHEARWVFRWRSAVDLRAAMLPAARFDEVYAAGTRQNKANRPGLLRYYVARRFDSRAFENGGYRVDVEASDVHGNRARAHLPFRIRNRL
jgi:hypothetical protein